ncbi:cysteine-rich receptor-like protein kinase 25 isoform X3 [Triticum urartu]|nr:cysteine-rich receptor-like protein kinase 25 isoform X3 [Triticum urartu]
MDMQMYRGHAVVAALVLLTTVTAASPTGYWGYLCDGGNYSAPSKYQQNLEQLSATLPEAVASSPTLFHTQAVGSSHDRAYALARCRGDTEADDCRRCLTQAFQDARAVCTFRKGISIYYDTCSLWFAEKKIKIHLGDSQSVLRADGPPIPTQCKAFQNDASTLIADVARKASDSSQRYATGEKGRDERACNYTLYTLADCLPGISAAQCQVCLEDLTSTPGLSGGQMGERKATLLCSYRLEPYQFFRDTKGHKNKTVWIVVGVAGGAVLLAIALLLWWWLLAKRPSAIDSFNKITANWQGKTIALFLDYDGTLAPKVDNPDEAYMSSEMREVVQELASLCATSVVSGRARDKAESFVMIENLHYAGSHGAEIKLIDETEAYEPARKYVPVINQARERLEEAIKEIKGASIEHKKFGISVHYRCVEEEEQELVKKLAKQTIKGFSELTVTKGDKVVEVRPKAEFNKGFAVKYILEQLARKNNWDSSQVVAIFIGDDKTDEDAFKVLWKRVGGLGILVNKKRKWTKASYSLEDPAQVQKFLQMLLSWKKKAEAEV